MAPCENLIDHVAALGVHISRLDEIGCKYLATGDVHLQKAHFKTSRYPCIFILYNVRIELIFHDLPSNSMC